MKENGYMCLYASLFHSDLSPHTLATEMGILAEWEAAMQAPSAPNLQQQQDNREALQLRNKQRCRQLISDNGPEALTHGWMSANGNSSLYMSCIYSGLSFKELADEFGIRAEWDAVMRSSRHNGAVKATQRRGQEVWTKELIIEYTANLCKEFKCLPASPWLAANGHSGFVSHVPLVGSSFPELRARFSPGPAKSRSIDGVHWDSYTEAAVANYLLARAISLVPGRPYPAAFFDTTGRHGIYDMHFVATTPEYVGKEITVEIFCGGPVNGNPALLEKYQRKRELKENFHLGDPLFLVLEYDECNNERKLQVKLQPFIGDPDISITYKDYASYQLPPTKWSLIDDLLQQAKEICNHTEDGKLPSTDWLCQTGSYKERPKCPWERSSYEWFREQVYQIGGWVMLRKLLGEEVQKTEWTQSELVEEFRLIYDKYNKTPNTLFSFMIGRKKAKSEIDTEWGNRARRAYLWSKKIFPGGHQEACIKAEIPVRIKKERRV